MQLSQELPAGRLFVRACSAESITVVDRALTRSFLLAPDRVVEDWPVHRIDELDAATLTPILALEPEVILLGTGERQRFPPSSVLAEFLRRGIGIEVMDNAAACRTWNLLAGEGRHVVAALMLPL